MNEFCNNELKIEKNKFCINILDKVIEQLILNLDIDTVKLIDATFFIYVFVHAFHAILHFKISHKRIKIRCLIIIN